MSEEKVNMDLLRHELPIQIIDFTSLVISHNPS